jgi:hypothetical protein
MPLGMCECSFSPIFTSDVLSRVLDVWVSKILQISLEDLHSFGSVHALPQVPSRNPARFVMIHPCARIQFLSYLHMRGLGSSMCCRSYAF